MKKIFGFIVLQMICVHAHANPPFDRMPQKCISTIKKIVTENSGLAVANITGVVLSNNNEVGLSTTYANWQKDTLANISDRNTRLDKCMAKYETIKDETKRRIKVAGCAAEFNTDTVNERNFVLNPAERAAGEIVSWSPARAVYNVMSGKDINSDDVSPRGNGRRLRDSHIAPQRSFLLFNPADKDKMFAATCNLAGRLEDLETGAETPRRECAKDEVELVAVPHVRVNFDKNGSLSSLTIVRNGTQMDYVLDASCATAISSVGTSTGTRLDVVTRQLCDSSKWSKNGLLAKSLDTKLTEQCTRLLPEAQPHNAEAGKTKGKP